MTALFPDLPLPAAEQAGMQDVLDSLFLLREQLRYGMENLDADNFNETGLNDLGTRLTAPVTARLTDDEGKITSLQLTADGLATRVGGAEGNISSLRQTVDGISLEVTDGVDHATLTLKSGSTVFSSEEIRLSGMVTFADLAGAGETVINGANITTGIISGRLMRACDFETLLTTEGEVGGSIRMKYFKEGTVDLVAGTIRLDDQGAGGDEGRYRMILSTNRIYYGGSPIDFHIKLESAGGVSLQSTHGGVYLVSGGEWMASAQGDLYLRADGEYRIWSDGAYRELPDYIRDCGAVARFA